LATAGDDNKDMLYRLISTSTTSPVTDWGTFTTSGTPIKIHEWSSSTAWTFEPHENLDDAQLEALIGTVIDSIVARAVGPRDGDLPEPLEPESPGFIYLREGTGVTPTIWRSEPLGGSSNTTTYWSSSSEGCFTFTND